VAPLWALRLDEAITFLLVFWGLLVKYETELRALADWSRS